MVPLISSSIKKQKSSLEPLNITNWEKPLTYKKKLEQFQAKGVIIKIYKLIDKK